jgi:RNA polymerase sigma-70 factor (ECF subfamily)
VTNENALIKKAQGGDREAFCELARIYGRRLHLFALRYTHSAADAEDLSQEVWLRAFKAIEGFRGEAQFYTWLRRIAIRTFLNNRRAAVLEIELNVEDAEFESLNGWHEDFTDRLHDKILIEKIRGFLIELTGAQRLIFLLKYDEGMTYEEIGRELECSSGTVKKSVFRSTQKLREKFSTNDLTEKKAKV